jgi:hypothetical protein
MYSEDFMEDTLKPKIRELANKYEIPEEMILEAIALEQEKVVLKNRRLAPKLVEMVERYAERYPAVTSQEDE